ncbi:MAG TPA: type I phosphomannose isomerase catalytic subunit [Candidatus Methylomirabilis sp.]|nr:type I phosphomannose isomerase catalytic subunit [Candidatus Methylomirabilis sp.]
MRLSREPNPEPFRIEPTFSPRIWGARSLAPLFPEKTNLAEPIGEAWLTDVKCRVATGPLVGKTLGEAWREMPVHWRGSRYAEAGDFPLLAKFIFPTDKLSIQVHPDDAYASVHEKAAGGRGKTEMWHVVSAEPGAQVLVGLKPGVTREQFLAALTNHTLEDCFVAYDAHAGDTFFIPAGTPHTIGPGVVLCEVQQYSDLTYRVYDYGRVDAQGRPRELHVEKALEVIRFGKSQRGKVPRSPLPIERAYRSLLTACPYFAAERWELLASSRATALRERFEVLIILQGTGYIHWSGSPLMYKRGQCWFVPASLGAFSLQPEQKSAVVRAYVPDLAVLVEELQKSAMPTSSISQSVFA